LDREAAGKKCRGRYRKKRKLDFHAFLGVSGYAGEGALLEWWLINKMSMAWPAAIRDILPPPTQPFISQVPHTFS
jgi:hypothetical protein